MNHFFKSVVAASFFLTAFNAEAQPGYGSRYDSRYRREPLDEVRADLERAARDMNSLSRHEMSRINKVHREITDFQRKWERGRLDRSELNDVIRSLEQVVSRNRLHPRDRDMLGNDILRLRSFRDRGFR